MNAQIELLIDIQRLIFVRDEHAANGDGSRLEDLSDRINALRNGLEPTYAALFERLYAKNHIFIAAMSGGACSCCGMRMPTAKKQVVALGGEIATCPNCGRFLYAEPSDAIRGGLPELKNKVVSRATLQRYSAEELMIPELQATDAEGAIAELAALMCQQGFVSDDAALKTAALRREDVLPTSVEGGLAFPHVRGIEGGALTLAMGRSSRGVDWFGRKVNVVFLTAFPLAASQFYTRLVSGIVQTFANPKKRDWIMSPTDRASLWRGVLKATRGDTK